MSTTPIYLELALNHAYSNVCSNLSRFDPLWTFLTGFGSNLNNPMWRPRHPIKVVPSLTGEGVNTYIHTKSLLEIKTPDTPLLKLSFV
jgi:hypothetical protein